jgi:CheY-like chemotaxis protein
MPSRVVAVVKDLFFVARIRETSRLVGTPVAFAQSPEELETVLDGEPPRLVILDLTTPGWDHEALLGILESRTPKPPVLGYTTHALASKTRIFHPRCGRVVTKETLTQELAGLLREGLAV